MAIANKKVDDKTGKRYGKLVVLDFTGEVHPTGGAIWNCKCDCGTLVKVKAFALKVGHKKSCGCLIKDIGVNRRLPKGEAGLRRVIENLKRRSRDSNRGYDLEDSYVKDMTSKDCFYCGRKPRSVSHFTIKTNSLTQEAIDNGRYFYNGLDRLDNSLGYIMGNVVTCCEICNKIRNKFLSPEEMIEVIKLLKKMRNTENLW